MIERILKWIVINVGLGFIPIAIPIMMYTFSMNLYQSDFLIEIIFLILVICAATLDDASVIRAKRPKAAILFYISFVFTVAIIVVYSVKSFELITHTPVFINTDFIVTFLKIYAFLSCVFGVLVQVIVHKIENITRD